MYVCVLGLWLFEYYRLPVIVCVAASTIVCKLISCLLCLTLQARRKEVFLQERYGHFSMTDPFLALQRDFESEPGPKDRRAVSASPITILEAVMAHCRKMQERMSAQLAAAENRQKRVRIEFKHAFHHF